MMEIKYMDK